MATVKEVVAKFQAEIKGAQRAFRTLRDEAAKLGPETKKSTDQVNKQYDSLIKSSEKLQKAMKDSGNPDVFNGLTKAIQKAQDEMAETGSVSDKSMKALRDAVVTSQRSFDELGDEARKGMSGIEDAISDVNRDLKTLGVDTGLDNVVKETDRATDATEELGDEAKETARRVDDLEGEFDGMGDTAASETSVAGNAIEKLGKTAMGIVGTMAGVFAVDKIKDFFVNTVETTAELDAVRDQYEQVMGKMVEDTDKYLDQMSEKWNKHPNELQNAYMQYVAILKGKGVAEEEAHDIAKQYLERTVDANAFANEDMADTVGRFMGVIKGEYDSADSAMVNMTQTMMNDLAVKEYGKKWEELSVQQQETLKTQEALRQHTSAGVVGQGAREAKNYTNNVAMLKNTWNEFLNDYGGPALAVANKGLKVAIEFIEGLDERIQNAGDSLEPFWGAFQKVQDLFKGGDETMNVLKSFGLGPETLDKISHFGNLTQEILSKIRDEGVPRLKEIGGALQDNLVKVWDKVKPGVEAAIGFVLDIFTKVLEFWESDGQQVFEAVSNIFNGILSVIKFVMPLVLGIIKTVWGNIKGVISGALDVIMGLVKVFTGLFTGDFSKMWEGIKQVFFGAIEFIWNFIQLTFYGRILKGAKAFIGAFRSGFAAMWTGVKALFAGGVKSAWELIKNGWSIIWNSTKSLFTNIWTFIRDTWTTIKNITSGAINLVRGFITNGWNFIKSLTSTTFSGIWNTIKTIFSNVWNFIKSTVSNIRTRISDTWHGIKNSTVNTFKGIYDEIVKRFNDIVDAAKALPKKIGDGIGSMASKVSEGITKVINTMASVLGKGVNGVLGGINWVLEKINVTTLPLWPVPQYAKGTDGHPQDGPAIVGDGRGAYKGRELIALPDGNAFLSPDKDTLIPNMPRGTQVLNAKDTRDFLGNVPKYWKGVGKGVKNLYGKAKDFALNVFDYVKNPGKLLDVALDKLGIVKPSAGGLAGDIVGGVWNMLKEKALGFLGGKLKSAEGSFDVGGAKGFGSGFRLTSRAGWRNHPILRRPMFHFGDDLAAAPGTPVRSQSSGIVSAAGYHNIRGNYVKIKSGIYEMVYQHLSKILVGRGQSVGKGQSIGTVGSTGRSTGPHLHFETWKNGQFVPPVSLGFEDGGIASGKYGAQLAWLTEGGWAESIISHDPAKKMSQKAIWETTGRELGFFDDGQESSEAIGLLQRIAEAVERGMDLSVIMNDRVVGRILAPVITEFQKRNEARSARFT